MDEYDDDEIELPRFECRLPIPDEITGGDRMLLQQVDILRQEIAFVFKRTNLGRRAMKLALSNTAKIEAFNRMYWMILGGAMVVGFLVGLYFKLSK